MMEAEEGDRFGWEKGRERKFWRYYAAGFQDGRRGHQPKNAGGL